MEGWFEVSTLLLLAFVAGVSAGFTLYSFVNKHIIDLALSATKLARKNSDSFSACTSFICLLSADGATAGDVEELRDRLRIISEADYG